MQAMGQYDNFLVIFHTHVTPEYMTYDDIEVILETKESWLDQAHAGIRTLYGTILWEDDNYLIEKAVEQNRVIVYFFMSSMSSSSSGQWITSSSPLSS